MVLQQSVKPTSSFHGRWFEFLHFGFQILTEPCQVGPHGAHGRVAFVQLAFALLQLGFHSLIQLLAFGHHAQIVHDLIPIVVCEDVHHRIHCFRNGPEVLLGETGGENEIYDQLDKGFRQQAAEDSEHPQPIGTDFRILALRHSVQHQLEIAFGHLLE